MLVDLWDEAGKRENNLVRVPLPTGITSRRYKVQRADSLPASQRRNGTVRVDLTRPHNSNSNPLLQAYSFSDPQVSPETVHDVSTQAPQSPTHQRGPSNGTSAKRRRNGSSIDG